MGQYQESYLLRLIGAEIVDAGFPPQKVEGGGIAFDYRRKGETKVRRIIIGHTELGSWLESDEEL